MSESNERPRATWFRVLIAMSLCLPAAALWAQITPVYRLRMERATAGQFETEVSGRATDGNLLQLERTTPLYYLSTTEYLDRPGGVTARFFSPQWDHPTDAWDLQVGAPSLRRSWTHPNINLPPGQTSTMEVDIYEGAPAGQTRFVRGVAVCPSSGALTNNDRIKGIRLYWGRIPPGATSTRDITTRANDYAQFRRANCNENNGWLPAQMCGPGQVATGVKVHRSNDGAVGIQLLCDRLVLMTDDEGRAEFARLNPGGTYGGTRPAETTTPAFPDRPSQLPTRPR
jgi:hypothetical protein